MIQDPSPPTTHLSSDSTSRKGKSWHHKPASNVALTSVCFTLAASTSCHAACRCLPLCAEGRDVASAPGLAESAPSSELASSLTAEGMHTEKQSRKRVYVMRNHWLGCQYSPAAARSSCHMLQQSSSTGHTWFECPAQQRVLSCSV